MYSCQYSLLGWIIPCKHIFISSKVQMCRRNTVFYQTIRVNVNKYYLLIKLMGYDSMQIDIYGYYTFDCLEGGGIKLLQDLGTRISVHLPSYVCEDWNIYQQYCENIIYCRTCLVRVCLWGRQSETAYIHQKSSDAHCCWIRCVNILCYLHIFRLFDNKSKFHLLDVIFRPGNVGRWNDFTW